MLHQLISATDEIKIGDFGVSTVIATGMYLEDHAGTFTHMAPECISGDQYSLKTDIWSLGVILYDLCALQLPFNA